MEGKVEEWGFLAEAMAVLSGAFLTPVLAHDVSESAFVTGRKVDHVSSHCCSVRSALPVSVKARHGAGEAESVDFTAKKAEGGEERAGAVVSRRGALAGLTVSAAALAALALSSENAFAVQQNQLAGRIPGLSEPDSNGISSFASFFFVYCLKSLHKYILDFEVLQCEPHERLVLTLNHRILTFPSTG